MGLRYHPTQLHLRIFLTELLLSCHHLSKYIGTSFFPVCLTYIDMRKTWFALKLANLFCRQLFYRKNS
ncbi:hypothetical protein AAZX31_09G045800 [Glycine max]